METSPLDLSTLMNNWLTHSLMSKRTDGWLYLHQTRYIRPIWSSLRGSTVIIEIRSRSYLIRVANKELILYNEEYLNYTCIFRNLFYFFPYHIFAIGGYQIPLLIALISFSPYKEGIFPDLETQGFIFVFFSSLQFNTCYKRGLMGYCRGTSVN